MKTYYYAEICNCRGVDLEKSGSIEAENILVALFNAKINLSGIMDMEYAKEEEFMEIAKEEYTILVGTDKGQIEKSVGEILANF